MLVDKEVKYLLWRKKKKKERESNVTWGTDPWLGDLHFRKHETVSSYVVGVSMLPDARQGGKVSVQTEHGHM